jgi:hypothetical protein
MLLFMAFDVGAEAQQQSIIYDIIPTLTSSTVVPIAVDTIQANWKGSEVSMAGGQRITIRVGKQ